MTEEEWKENFKEYLEARGGITEILFDLDIVDLEVAGWAIEQVELMYGDTVEIYFFRSSDGAPPVPASIRGL